MLGQIAGQRLPDGRCLLEAKGVRIEMRAIRMCRAVDVLLRRDEQSRGATEAKENTAQPQAIRIHVAEA
jgi:hypothetical protein